MQINNPKTGINDSCDGRCYCHSMDMIFGNDPNRCAECGCPKTEKGFRDFQKTQKTYVQP